MDRSAINPTPRIASSTIEPWNSSAGPSMTTEPPAVTTRVSTFSTIRTNEAIRAPKTIRSCRKRRTPRGANASTRTETMAAPKITIIGEIAK
jgi:hypothetical protein